MASRGRSTDWQREAAAQRRAAEQAAKQAAREAEQHHKAQVRAYEQSRAERAAALTAASEERVRELNGLLAASLSSPPRPLDFETMKKRPSARPLDMGADAEPISAPVWGNFEPPPAGALSRLFGGDRRYARDHAAAEVAFADAVDQHKSAEIARQQRVVSARRAHAELQASDRAAAAQKNAEVDAFADAVRARDRHAASEYFQLVIDAVADPDGFPSGRVAGYVPESTLLAVEWQLPAPDVVPPEKVVRWVKARDEFTRTARPPTEVRQTYQRLVAQLALRALNTVFTGDRFGLITTVVFNGIVQAIDRSTGRTITPCLITLRATREQFVPLVLAEVDPLACVRRHFAADVSPHPEELQAVPPVMEFKMADPRIVDPVDVISELDKRPNLLELLPKEFEHFVHNLFTRMGFDTKVFQAHGDGGVDCVAYDPTPIRGGKYVIQAKLYNKTVPPTAVRDLYGTMQHEGAKSGILIATSGFGPSSYEFANGKPLQLIDGSGLLALCAEYDIPARIVAVRKK